ncbi:MAG: hypothetical protein ACE5GD_08970 [Candidatus Geothermarchaeales archaeon]
MIKIPYTTLRGRRLPLATLEIRGVIFTAYVDSGATYSVFHSGEAEIIGVDVEKGRWTTLTVGDGHEIPVYLHTLPVIFLDRKFEAIIGFTNKLRMGFNILGRKDFFEKFTICFNDSEAMITAHEHGKF